ncbi:unnamed protein product [Cylindrotheca closterium]|uniref:Uncharacterized protein n=1 Tax=Cylindrotheca closterium TaxID=2856 RepID=A0AAD2JG80_9STRA|nr:unnamed protein product [Cylindrotheca closterium]
MSPLSDIEANNSMNLIIKDSAEEVSSDFHRLLNALKSNTKIVAIRFEGDFLDDLTSLERGQVLEAIAVIPCLRTVHLGDSFIFTKDIAAMLKSIPGLLELTMSDMVLQGIQVDFDQLEQALHAHSGLKFFKMDNCVTSVQDIDMSNLKKSEKKLSTISSPVVHMAAAQSA